MNTNQKGFTKIIIVLTVVVLVGAVGYLIFNKQKVSVPAPTATSQMPVPTPIPNNVSSSTSEPKNDLLTVSLGQQFTLKKNQFAKIVNTGLEIGIIEFYNSPCPKNVQCFWSGVGVGFEYRFNGEVQKGIDLVQAFGYQTNIVKTDYETYANLVFEKIK
jgi:hypothetical protein